MILPKVFFSFAAIANTARIAVACPSKGSARDGRSSSSSSLQPTTFTLKQITAKVSTLDGAGMDGGVGDVSSFGGGEFKMRICAKTAELRGGGGEGGGGGGSEAERCCWTPYLNTKDDNWERGETNYFAGSTQIGEECHGLVINDGEHLALTLKHKGNDGGLLDYVSLHGAFGILDHFYNCRIGVKLDNTEEETFSCHRESVERGSSSPPPCNGHSDFCALNFANFTFAGTHNAGTGQSDYRILHCAAKNQDLTVTEQLDFGIRFFDFDIIYSTSAPFCSGLETGHGKYPGMGVYQCFGQLGPMFRQMRQWLQQHPREVIVLYFGELQYEDESYPRLLRALRENFPAMLNDEFKSIGKWPSIGEAVLSGKRVFVFVRSPSVGPGDLEVVQEIQVSADPDERGNDAAVREGQVSIISTYESGTIDEQCSLVLKNARNSCGLVADFTKIAIFGTFGSHGPIGTTCLWDIARKCNPTIGAAIAACGAANGGKPPNFLQVDYPNYPGAGGNHTVTEVAFAINSARKYADSMF